MKLVNKILFCVFLIPSIGFSNGTLKKKHEKTKTIHKTFVVDSNATLYVDNKYGNLYVTTWDENRIEIEVKITVKGDGLEDVVNKLDAINVKFEATESLVEARTSIENKKRSWSWWWGGNNINYKINYYIKMPVTNNADLNNEYGNIELDTLEGKANIDCEYGDIDIDKLLNASNSIQLDYCSNSDIKYIKSGTINADYSKIRINETESLKASADYTTVKIGKAERLVFNSDYGGVSVNEVDHVSGSSDYSSLRFDTVNKELTIDTEYGSLRINDLQKGFENVNIEGDYTGIRIGTSSDNNFSFTIDLDYSGFNFPKTHVDMFKSVKKTTSKYYEGVFGEKNPNSKITINSSYGGVSLKLNDH